MDFSQYVLLGLLLAGITELISRVRATDWWVVGTIVSCVVVGGLCGLLERFGVPSIEVGILVGFGTSGAFKLASVVGNKSTPAPSSLTEKAKQ